MVGDRKPRPPAPDKVAQIVRQRRLHLGWSLAKAAKAARIASPSYVFHIENGQKAPSAKVAVRLAEALGLDADLLRAWALTRGRNDLETAFEASATLSRLLGGAADGAGEVPVSRSQEEAGPEAPPDSEPDAEFLEVPLLPEGADPDARAGSASAPIEVLRLDRRLFPALGSSSRTIGYRLSAHGVRRVAGTLHPGDFVVVRVGGGEPALDAPCAVRLGGRVEIVRVRVRDGAVHVPGAGHAGEFGDPGERLPGSAEEVLVGPVVVAFRRWL